MFRIGAHVSAAGGVQNAPIHAHDFGLDIFQFFSRPPQGGPAPKLDQPVTEKFFKNCEKFGFDTWYVHTPYIINLASDKDRVRHTSIGLIRTDLERATTLRARAVMTHLGSAAKVGEKTGRKLVAEGVKKILDGYDGSAQLLLEISAGAGAIIGDTFEEMADILNQVGDNQVGVCFDTAHAFASGYDLRTAAAVKKTMEEFDHYIGLDRLVLAHLNDSKIPLGGHKDRHEHLGDGHIGLKGFKALLRHPRFRDLDLILETEPEKQAQDIKLLRKLQKQYK